MVIDYFEKYPIDTDDIEDKLNIISQSKTENASYIHRTLIKALTHLFSSIPLKANFLTNQLLKDTSSNIVMIYFDDIFDDSKVSKQIIHLSQIVSRLIIIGNHENDKIGDNIFKINLKKWKTFLKLIDDKDLVYIGFNADAINNEKYYYNKMRNYFLNVLYKIYNTSIEELKENTEEVCTRILLDNDNFISRHNDNNYIKLKNMILLISKIESIIGKERLLSSSLYYRVEGNMTRQKIEMLNSVSELINVSNMKSTEERASYVYDKICKQMLDEASILQYCNFVDNKCVSMRYTDNSFPNSKENGCCNNTYLDKNKNCRYLQKDYSCSICAISCKVFTCAYLQNRGIDHSLWQYPLIDCTIRKIIRGKIVFGFFKPKEKMIPILKYGFRLK